jgi:hypothetical protein
MSQASRTRNKPKTPAPNSQSNNPQAPTGKNGADTLPEDTRGESDAPEHVSPEPSSGEEGVNNTRVNNEERNARDKGFCFWQLPGKSGGGELGKQAQRPGIAQLPPILPSDKKKKTKRRKHRRHRDSSSSSSDSSDSDDKEIPFFLTPENLVEATPAHLRNNPAYLALAPTITRAKPGYYLSNDCCHQTELLRRFYKDNKRKAKRIREENPAPTISEPIWKKIIANDFVDLEELPGTYYYTEGKHQKNSQTITSFVDWDDRFDTYTRAVGIYYPHRLVELNGYRQYIRELARQFVFNSILPYDTAVRKHTAENRNAELTTPPPVITNVFQTNFRPLQRQDNQNRIGRTGRQQGTCWAYNSADSCLNSACQYLHRCQNCNRTGHPIATCRRLQASSREGREDRRPNQKNSGNQQQHAGHKINWGFPTANNILTDNTEPYLESVYISETMTPPPHPPLTLAEQKIHSELAPNIRKLASPVRLDRLLYLLRDHPNKPLVEWLRQVFTEGCRLGVGKERQPQHSKNLPSLDTDPEATAEFLKEQVERGFLIGPLSENPHPLSVISPAGFVPKPGSRVGRLINHLSFPRGASINDAIEPDDFRTHYEGLGTLLRWVRHLGKGSIWWSFDIRDAYKLIPVHPVDRLWQVLCIQGKYYVMPVLNFGGRSSPAIFDTFAHALNWILVHHGVPVSIHYLDDFNQGCPASGRDLATHWFHLTMSILDFLGIPVKQEKTQPPPARPLKALGVTIDTMMMSVSLPEEKCHSMVQQLMSMHNRDWIFIDEVRSLIGRLLWFAQVLPLGRLYTQALIGKLKGQPRRHCYLSSRIRADFDWWIVILSRWSGTRLLEDKFWQDAAMVGLVCDASSTGGGFKFENLWAAWTWTAPTDSQHINWKELATILILIKTLGPRLGRLKILIASDNLGNVEAVNKGYFKENHLNDLLKEIHLEQSIYNCRVRLRHITTKQNFVADLLSRGRIPQIRALFPTSKHLEPITTPAIAISPLYPIERTGI